MVDKHGNVPGTFRSAWHVRQWWLAALAWMGLIFWLSAQPDLPHAPEPWLDMVVKKAGHAVLYGVLAWLYLRALQENGLSSGRTRLLAFGLAVLYAVTDEVHQSFVPGRTPSPWDVLIDGAGAALAVTRNFRPTLKRRADSVKPLRG
jgi:VanZ family protein